MQGNDGRPVGTMVPQPAQPSDRQLDSNRQAPGPLSALNAQSACVTKIESIALRQYWKVEGFDKTLKAPETGDCLRSQMFGDSKYPAVSWQLILYPGKRVVNSYDVSLNLQMSAVELNEKVHLKVEYELYLLDEMDMPVYSKVAVQGFYKHSSEENISRELFDLSKEKVQSFIHGDGSLVISFLLKFVSEYSKAKCYDFTVTHPFKVKTIGCENFKEKLEAFETGYMADCTIICDGVSLPVNKFILTTHSQVFRAMFDHDIVESRDNAIAIEDSDVDSVRAMLRYMYTGEADPSMNTEGVLVLAERYQMEELKQICEQRLCVTTDRSNLIDRMHVADLYNLEALQRVTVSLFRAHKDYVYSLRQWQELNETNPRFVISILQKAVIEPPVKRQRCSK